MVATTGFQSAVFPMVIGDLAVPGYAALYALLINIALSVLLSLMLNPIRATRGTDETGETDYGLGTAAVLPTHDRTATT
jgi:SSS family solute:Na+ symporter